MVDLRLRSIVAFLLTEGAWDNAQGWASLTADERNTTKAAYNDAGIALMVSAFGSSDTPTSSGTDPTDTANTMAAWVIQYGLDGIDVDYEVSRLRAYICLQRQNEHLGTGLQRIRQRNRGSMAHHVHSGAPRQAPCERLHHHPCSFVPAFLYCLAG